MATMGSDRVFGEAELRRFAADLDRASEAIKQDVALLPQQAAVRIVARAQAAYPIGPVHWHQGQRIGGGTLRNSVTQAVPRGASTTAGGAYIPMAVVRVLAPHVHFYEDGTEMRQDPTRKNANRGRVVGRGPVFVSIVTEERAQMYRQAQDVLDRDREIG